MALVALSIHAPQLITGDIFANIINGVISCEKNPGGPYYTWMVPKKLRRGWNDVDIVVNANIAHFLKRQNIDLPGLTMYVEDFIRQENFSSKYYSPLHAIYFISKSYRGKNSLFLRKRLLRFPLKNNLETALAISAWIRLGGNLKTIQKWIVSITQSSRATKWQPHPFYIEEIKNGSPIYSESSFITAACVAEALSLYQKSLSDQSEKIYNLQLNKLARSVARRSLLRFKNTPSVLQKQMLCMVKKIMSQDIHHEIALTPWFIYENLINQQGISRDEVLDLCAINLLGWIGYTICDNLLDGHGRPEQLPAAIIAIRTVAITFQQHGKTLDDLLIIPSLLSRSNNLKDIAKKSLGHALAPMMILQKTSTLSDVQFMHRFFTNYLVVRQLNDDAHDWLDDLKNNIPTPVTIKLLEMYHKKYPKNVAPDLMIDQEKLTSLFWDTTIDWVADQIKIHCTRARNDLVKIKAFKNTDVLQSFVTRLEHVADQAILERDRTRGFLHHLNFG